MCLSGKSVSSDSAVLFEHILRADDYLAVCAAQCSRHVTCSSVGGVPCVFECPQGIVWNCVKTHSRADESGDVCWCVHVCGVSFC